MRLYYVQSSISAENGVSREQLKVEVTVTTTRKYSRSNTDADTHTDDDPHCRFHEQLITRRRTKTSASAFVKMLEVGMAVAYDRP